MQAGLAQAAARDQQLSQQLAVAVRTAQRLGPQLKAITASVRSLAVPGEGSSRAHPAAGTRRISTAVGLVAAFFTAIWRTVLFCRITSALG